MDKPKAILFDFDGVLADTLDDLFLSWKYAFSKFNVNIKKEDYFLLEGMNVLKIAKNISKKYGLIIDDYKKIVEIKNKFYLENHSFNFYDGVFELIEILKQENILIGIVSASPKEKLEKTVPKGFLEKFDVVISGDDVELGKPNPDPYLVAIKNLNLNPKECVVVENAPLGIKSAKSAGIFCIAICSTLEKSYLNEADIIIESFKDLKNTKILKKLF